MQELSTHIESYSMQGKRPTMEDELVYMPITPDICLYAIFDGHGGSKASEVVAEYLPRFISDMLKSLDSVHNPRFKNRKNSATTKAFTDNIPLILTHSFIQTQKYLENLDSELFKYQGTTALVIIRYFNKLFCANAGDCRAILYNPRKKSLKQLTVDHKPHKKKEFTRIQDLGGYVSKYAEIPRVWKEKGKTDVGLSTSRSIGDLDSKVAENTYLVTPEPDISSFNIQKGDVLVLACDGVWDVLSNEQVINTGLLEGAEGIAKRAYNTGSTDNISCLFCIL